MPVDEDREDENGFVDVAWRGNEANATLVPGLLLAELAIGEYVRFHSLAKPERAADELAHLAEHFRLKTGESLRLEEGHVPLLEMLGAMSRLIDKLGPAAALEAIKRLLGG